MKICIIQKQLFPYFGVMALSSVLKQQGHEIDVLIHAIEKDIFSSLTLISPDLIGFSVLSSEHRWLREMSLEINQRMPNIPIIVGGVHAILYPEDILKLRGVNFVCYGEGEVAVPILVERLAKGHYSAEGIAGIGYCREDDKPVIQGVTQLPEDLDSFIEDRTVYYDRYPVLRKLSQKIFMSSRGCPFRCAFCANSYIMDTFKDRGKYIRRKSPQYFIEEVKYVIKNYSADSLFFCDDLFVFDSKWLEEFAHLYKAEIDIPYICTARAGALKENHAKALAGSGCHTVSFGVETGNEWLRNDILKKKVKNKDIIECADIIKNAGMEIQTSNMFCLPHETIKEAVSTIELNQKIGTDYMFTTIFLPFPKTELAEYCSNRNLLKKDYTFDDIPESFVTDSVLILKDGEYITNIHKIAHLCLRFPLLKPFFIFLASKVPSRRLFFLFYLLGTFIRYKNERKLSFFQTLTYLWTYRKAY